MQFYQKCLYENFELRITFFIKNELSIDSYYNRKKSKRLFKIIREQTPLWLVTWTTKSIDIDLATNKYCKCVFISPYHVNQTLTFS